MPKQHPLELFFSPNAIAVIGASREEHKIGHVLVDNLRREGFPNVIPVNPAAEQIQDLKCYPNVQAIPEKVDIAIICIPGQFVPKAIADCGKAGIHHVIIISAGFKEVGNIKLEKQLEAALKKWKVRAIGPNCLGVLAPKTHVDTWFHPLERMRRPEPGGISFAAQSGAVGSAILDLAVKEGHRFAKVISYGNAVNTDESDLIEYLAQDPETKVICLYIEGLQNGKKFLAAAKKAAAKKPVLVLKGGKTAAGAKAAVSHTGTLAGEWPIYKGAFKQAGLVVAENLEEFFDHLKMFELMRIAPKGHRVQIITNGGGFGILTADAIVTSGLSLAQPSAATKAKLKKALPPAASISNPMDLLGDANNERYRAAIEASLADKNIDIVITIILPQVPLIGEDIVDMMGAIYAKAKKPMAVIITGGAFTEKLERKLEEKGIPCFVYPEGAARAIAAAHAWACKKGH